jgi:sugar/nucleoside kinase (ribokinase family)
VTSDAVVAGHLCLDIIPRFLSRGIVLEPGKLTEVGAATFATGGAVSNVGLSLLKLGVRTRLMGKVGDDAFSTVVKALLAQHDKDAVDTVKAAAKESTSYTIVISPVGTDRMFLHHPGCNDSYSVLDVDMAVVAATKLFYFGYPPLMKRIYADGGEALAGLLQRVKALGVTTALDMAMPDPNSDSGKADWRAFLARVLPHVDLFMPSLEETLFMLNRDAPQQEIWRTPSPAKPLHDLAQQLLDFGATIVGLKLGEHGLYLRTAGAERFSGMGRAAPFDTDGWTERELWSPVFQVDVQGTTGAGDATVAGFLAGLLKGLGPEAALTMATAVGACCVEAPDATSGVRSWEEIAARVEGEWPRAATHGQGGDWRKHPPSGVFVGPQDQVGRA